MKKKRTRTQLRRNTNSRKALARRLAGYSLTAGAALAVAPQAQGAVVYSGPLNQDFGPPIGEVGLGRLDVTVEGADPDLMFMAGNQMGGNAHLILAGAYVGTGGTVGDALVLAKDLTVPSPPFAETVMPFMVAAASSKFVGPGAMVPAHSRGFLDAEGVHATFGPFQYGYWAANGYRGPVGFSFMSEENPDLRLYGWAEVERLDPDHGRLLYWAYEDSGEPIHVPEPGSLALLALGAAGVAARRKRSKA